MSREEQRAQSRERIVDAAVEAFANFGFRAASTRDIASRAGVTQGLITYHFNSKDDLWKAAADRIFSELRAEVLDGVTPSTSEPREGARDAIRSYVRFAARRPELIRFMVEEGKHDSDRMNWLVDTHLRSMYESFATLAAAVVDRPDGFDVAHLYYVLAGGGSLIFALAPECRALAGIDPMSSARVEAHADLLAWLLIPDE